MKKFDKRTAIRLGIVFIANMINLYAVTGLLEYYGIIEEVPLVSAFLNIQFALITMGALYCEAVLNGDWKRIFRKKDAESVGTVIVLCVFVLVLVWMVAKDWHLWRSFFGI